MKHKVLKKQESSKDCFISGLKNGLQASFYELDNGEIVALFKPSKEHQGYPGRLHGGIASAILDETIGRAIMINHDDIWGVTVELNLRYKKPVPIEEELRVVGRITRDCSRLFEGTGEILLSNGEPAVTAEAKYIKLPLEKIADFDPLEQKWQVVSSDVDPEVIEY